MSLSDTTPDATKTLLGARIPENTTPLMHCPACGRLEVLEVPTALPLRGMISRHFARVIHNGLWVIRTPKVRCPGSNYLVPENEPALLGVQAAVPEPGPVVLHLQMLHLVRRH